MFRILSFMHTLNHDNAINQEKEYGKPFSPPKTTHALLLICSPPIHCSYDQSELSLLVGPIEISYQRKITPNNIILAC